MSKLYNTKFKPTKKGIVEAAVDYVIRKIPRKKKVSPDIKSVKPTKDVKGSIKRTKRDAFSKNIDDLKNDLSLAMVDEANSIIEIKEQPELEINLSK